jgi:pimeloyl-[acyl-carrier protein] synthase
MPGAVEEFLRYDSPVQRTGRVALQDLELNGRTYYQGQRVNMLVGAANRDPDQFAEPDRLDITRSNASQHLSFAAGIHYCVGAPLARLEAQRAIGALLGRYPRLRLTDAAPVWRPTFVLHGLRELQVATA